MIKKRREKKIPRSFKQSQDRRTFSDVKSYQDELKYLLQKKIKQNKGLTYDESNRFNDIYPWALFGHDSSPYTFKNFDGRISNFVHISSLIDNLIMLKDTVPFLLLIDGSTNDKYIVEWKHVWKSLLKQFFYLFPYAREAALHMSAEAPTREEASSYKFSLDKKID